MLNVKQFRLTTVRPALEFLGLHTDAAEQLVLCTALQESHLIYVDQLDRAGSFRIGPAVGFFQMERLTHDDHWVWLRSQKELGDRLKMLVAPYPEPWEQMMTNSLYAAAMCRIHYRRIRAPLPPADSLEGLASYWKQYYNTRLGKGTVEQFIASCAPYWKEGL